MKHDRELWEKAREDRVPHNAFWDAISPAPACSAYGKREYSSTLQNIPEGWTAIDACINMPIEIKGVAVRRPNRCAFVKGSPHVHGYWTVDWDEPSCKPRWYNYQDVVSVNRPLFARTSVFTPSQGCTSYKSGVRRIEGELVGLIDKKDQDLGLMCASTPLTWNYITYTSPTHCEERVSESRVHHVVRKANSSHDSTLTECLECGTCPTTVACNLLHPVRKILTHPVVPWHCTFDFAYVETTQT